MSSIEYRLEQMAYANTSRQMTWQENMSNTSHQREVKDLVSAGLNPVLSSGGQGAQSYTTSVDSAVNAIGNIAATREAAAAQRYAARQSAAATRAAAAAQLEAAKYSADASYKGTVYKTDRTTVGAAIKYITNAFKAIPMNNFVIKLNKQAQKDSNQIGNHLDVYLKDPSLKGKDKFAYSNFSHDAKALANNACKQLGIPSTAKNRTIYLQMCTGSKMAATQWAALVRAANKRQNSSRVQYRPVH